MQRCYIPPDQWREDRLPLDNKEKHHLVHVLRLAAGTPVCAFDGRGREARTHLEWDNTSENAYLQVLECKEAQSQPAGMEWIVVPAIIKGTRMDSLIEKATELGANRIIPIQTSRCVVRLNPAQAAKKVERWQRISISAAKQCGTPQLPEIEAVRNLTDVLRTLRTQNTPILLGSLSGNPQPLARKAKDLLDQKPDSIAFITGPEGDFTPDEYAQLQNDHCIPVSLGPLTLRAETANIYALSVMQAVHQEMQTQN